MVSKSGLRLLAGVKMTRQSPCKERIVADIDDATELPTLTRTQVARLMQQAYEAGEYALGLDVNAIIEGDK